MDYEKKDLMAAEVKKYPLLYNKSNKQYKNHVVVDQAWSKIAAYSSHAFYVCANGNERLRAYSPRIFAVSTCTCAKRA